ncbi:MAG: hypothetical protein ACKO4Q_12500, partial [Planctomycetota bacterium]
MLDHPRRVALPHKLFAQVRAREALGHAGDGEHRGGREIGVVPGGQLDEAGQGLLGSVQPWGRA